MRPTQFPAEVIVALLRRQKVATLPEIMEALGTHARRTVFRKLRALPVRSSYSHRGRYYTLEEVAAWDDRGLWSHHGVRFSAYGTLLSTAAALVEGSPSGFFVEELDRELHVGTKDALRKLVDDGRLRRERLGGRFLYGAADPARQRRQGCARRARLTAPGAVGPMPAAALLPDELRAAIVLFFSVLDEKQRRLYAGLEALKTGRGGDAQIAEVLGVHVDTVARGRQELLRQDVEMEWVRKAGGGRTAVKKKRRK